MVLHNISLSLIVLPSLLVRSLVLFCLSVSFEYINIHETHITSTRKFSQPFSTQ